MEASAVEVSATSPRMVRDGMKNLFKVQNVLLDYVAAQNAIAFKIIRERMKADEASPASSLIDSVEEIAEGMVAMQRSFVGLGEDRLEREPAAEATEATETPEKTRPAFPFGQLMRRNFEAAVSAQREILGLVEKQGKLGVKAAEEIARFSTGKTLKGLASMAKESIDNVLATQASLSTLAAKQNKENIALIADQEKPLLSKTVARALEEGIDNLHRAQKNLLDIAGEMNARVYERAEASSEEATEASSSIADRVESGIEKIVKAQNDLLDAGLRAVNRKTPANN